MEEDLENQEEQTLNPSTYLQDLVARAKARKAQTDVGTYGAQSLSTMVGQMGGVKTDTRPFEEMRKSAAGEVESAEVSAEKDKLQRSKELLELAKLAKPAKEAEWRETEILRGGKPTKVLTRVNSQGVVETKDIGEAYIKPSSDGRTTSWTSAGVNPDNPDELIQRSTTGELRVVEKGRPGKLYEGKAPISIGSYMAPDRATATLRKEATSGNVGKIYDGYRNASSVLNNIEVYSANPSAFGDTAILLQGVKSLQNDTSVVREPEMRAAIKATNLENKLKNYYDSVATGKTLQPEQRQDMINTVRTARDILAKQYVAAIKPTLNQAKRKGIPVEDVVDSDIYEMVSRPEAPKQEATDFTDDKKKRLEELRAKKAAGTLGK